MFTGIVQRIGRIASIRRKGEGARLALRASFDDGRLVLGESVAVDGICLTVVRSSGSVFEADLSGETLRRTTAASWKAGRRVNLERALTPSSRLGGHFVQGHVDGRGRVAALGPGRGETVLRVEVPAELRPLVAEKGSIAVDGVSLTVAALGHDGWFDVAIIPHTLAATTLGDRRAGDGVNLEVDLLARHVARLLETGLAPRLPASVRAAPRPSAAVAAAAARPRNPGGGRTIPAKKAR